MGEFHAVASVGLGGTMATKSIKRGKTIKCSASAFLLLQKSKTENFLFLFEKNLGARHQKNVEKIFLFWDANFFKVCGRKRSGRKLFSKVFLEKSSSLVVNSHQNQTFRNFCGFFLGDLQKSPLFLRCGARFARGQNEVRLPCDL